MDSPVHPAHTSVLSKNQVKLLPFLPSEVQGAEDGPARMAVRSRGADGVALARQHSSQRPFIHFKSFGVISFEQMYIIHDPRGPRGDLFCEQVSY